MKLIKTVIALCLVITLAGCGKPSNVSEDTYNLGLKAVNVTEQFLEADLTADEAKDKLDEINNRIIYDQEGYEQDVLIAACIDLIGGKLFLSGGDTSGDDIKGIKENLESLKEYLGK